MAKDNNRERSGGDRGSKGGEGMIYRRRIGPDGKSYNFNVPPETKKPAPAAKPKAGTTPAKPVIPKPKPEKKPEAATAPKAEAPAPKADTPAPKKADAAPTKPPVYTKDAPGSEAEAYRGPVPKNERMRIQLAPTKRELDALMGVTGISRYIAGVGRNIANRGLRAASPKLLEAGKKLIEGPKPAPKPTPVGPRRLENANKDRKLLEYKPQPKARTTPKPKPKKPNPDQGSLNFRDGGRINGVAIRGRTKGRMV